METMDEIVMKSPLVNPHQLYQAQLYASENYPTDEMLEERSLTEEEITENNAKNATIENLITLFLTGSATGLTFSTAATAKQAEVTRALKWFGIKLFTKVNDQSLRADYIRLANSVATSAVFNSAFLILLINYTFDFKNRIVRNAVNEYNTWLATRVNTTYAIKEYDPGALPLLTKYWSATPTPPSPITSGPMWSAAFISWVIKESGATDLFAYSGAHINYIRAARINRRDSIQNPFRLYRINEFITRMQPGDLLCKGRAGSNLTFDNVLTNPNTSAHVDVITEIDRSNNKIRVVGGNVCDNVDHKGLNIVGTTRITNSDGENYFAGIGIGNA